MADSLVDSYITLPSNVPQLDGAQLNTPSHYKTPLPKPLELSPTEHEVALAAINYPHSWIKALSSSKCSYVYHKTGNNSITTTTVNYKGRKKELKTLEEVVEKLNEIRPSTFKGSFHITTKRYVSVQLRKGDSIGFRQDLSSLLGFEFPLQDYEQGTVINPKAPDQNKIYKIIAQRKPDLQMSKYNLFIYTNLVKHSLVGDRMVPLLGTVPINPDMEGKHVSESFQILRYVPLASNFFQNIEIQITDDFGDPIDFTFGKVIVTLHLRRKK